MSTEVQNTTSSQHDAKLLLCEGLNQSAQIIFQNNKAKGFWDNERNVGELLMLVTSELGEAMEARRKGRFAKLERLEFQLSPTSELPYERHYAAKFESHVKDTFEDEIADAVIRLLDLSAGLGIDLEKHINAKVKYNETRPKLHGKLY
jgi:NTP pyrophosphatase (non-canonical NTP hydrolase)